jgi:hypothetical protein
MATEIDKDLQATLKLAKAGRPMQFAFLAKGIGGTLLAAKRLLPAPIAEAKKKEGGTLFRGRLVGEDGALVFEVAKEPPANLAAQLKHSIKEHTGLLVDVVVRVKGDAEEEPAATEEPAAAGHAVVVARLQALTPGVKAALAGPAAARVQALLGTINGFIKGHDFAGAARALDELAPLVAGRPAAPPAAPPAEAPSPVAGQFKAALARLMPDAQHCLKEQAGDTGRIRAVLAFVQEKAAARDFARALQGLEILAPLVSAARAGTAGKETDVIAPGTVAAMREALTRAKERWDKAVTDAAAQVRKVQDGLRADDSELADDLEEVAHDYEGRLDQLLNLTRQADTEDSRQKALALVRELQADVLEDRVLSYLDTYEGATINLRETFAQAFTEVLRHLSA